MFGLFLGAAILGIIIAAMEDWDFPGWIPLIGCVLAAMVPIAVLNTALPPEYFFVGLGAGTLTAGLAISAFCGMSFQRAYTAAAIFLGVEVVFELAIRFLLSS